MILHEAVNDPAWKCSGNEINKILKQTPKYKKSNGKHCWTYLQQINHAKYTYSLSITKQQHPPLPAITFAVRKSSLKAEL